MGCSFNNTNKSMLKYTQLCDSAYYISYVGKNSPGEGGYKSRRFNMFC